MLRPRRPLLPALKLAPLEGPEQTVAAFAARYPGGEAYTDEQVLEFVAAAAWLDRLTPGIAVKVLRQAGLRVPAEMQVDMYHIGRYIFGRWQEPAVQQAVLGNIQYHPNALKRVQPEASPQGLLELCEQAGTLAVAGMLLRLGQGERIPELVAALPPGEAEHFRIGLVYMRALMRRYLTQPVSQRQPSRRAQRTMIRRIQRRGLQLHSLRRNIYRLGREHKALLGRIRQAERAAAAELEALGPALEQIRAELAAAEEKHAAVMAEHAAAQAAELDALDAQVAAALQDFAAALAERQRWIPLAPLRGAVVAVVGDSDREAGYRLLVESVGGRCVHASAVEKLQRVPDTVAGADIVILIAAAAKHQSEHMLRKAVGPGTLVLRCPAAGLAAFDRVLREAVLIKRRAELAREAESAKETEGAKEAEGGEGLALPGADSRDRVPRPGAHRGGATRGRSPGSRSPR